MKHSTDLDFHMQGSLGTNCTEGLPIIWKEDVLSAEYERARVGRVFNHRRPKRYPVAVVEAEKAEHVQEAVKLAKSEGLSVSVRSGGHSWAAWSVRDGSILIDLGKFQEIELDEASGIVKVSPSTTGRQLNGLLEEKNLMFPGGHCPDVGVGGFLLQGGMGWVCRSWGWACQRVKAIDAVTADGQLLHCSENENQDLFWAARGAGPGFPAVVTRFYLQPRPLPAHMRCSIFIYPKTLFKAAFNWVKDLIPEYDTDTEIVCVGQFVPEYEESIVLISFLTFKWSEKDASDALQHAGDTAPEGYLQAFLNKPTSLQQEYSQQAAANPQGHRYCCDNIYIDNDADVASVLEESFTTLPTRKTFSLWYSMAPISRRPLPDMALSMQSDHYFASYTVWEDESDDERCQSWVRNIMKNMAPHGIGQYLGDSDFQVRNTKYWGDAQGKKLMDIRREWNPDGRICGYLDQGDRSGVAGISNKL